MHNQRSQNALTRSGPRNELSSFLGLCGGVRWLKSRSRLAGSGTNGSVFERFRACALALTLAFVAVSVFGNWFHESLHRHCDHSAECACIALGAYGDSGCAIQSASEHEAFDCPICRLITHGRFFFWFAAASALYAVAFYFRRAATLFVAVRRVSVNIGRAPPQVVLS